MSAKVIINDEGIQFLGNGTFDTHGMVFTNVRPSFLTKTLNCEAYGFNPSLMVNLTSAPTINSNIIFKDTNHSSFSDIILEVSPIHAIPLHIITVVIAAIGVFGNVLLYSMMTYTNQKRTTYSLLVRATSVFDTLNLFFETNSRWVHTFNEIPLFLCDTISFFGIFTKLISSYFLILSTCDKLIMISNPLRWRIICNNSNIRRCITLIIVLSFWIAAVYICIVRIFSYCHYVPVNFQNCWQIIAFGNSPTIDIISYCLLYSISFIPCSILTVMNSISVFLLVVHFKEVKKMGCGTLLKVPYAALIVLTTSSFISFIPFAFLDLIAFGYGYTYQVFYLIYVLQFANKFYVLLMISDTFRNNFCNILKSARKAVI